MATFSHSNFNSKAYSAFRPTYQKSLYKYINDFHRIDPRASYNLAVDVGCGTGQASVELAEYYKQVIGVDPSDTMRSAAKSHPSVKYVQGSEVSLPVDNNTADIVTVAQALHWFDLPKFTSEVKRVLKPGGTLAVWGYGFLVFPENEKATKAYNDYFYDVMEAHFEPKAKLVKDNYREINLDFPYVIKQKLPNPNQDSFMKADMSIADVAQFCKTWSAYKNYLEKNAGAPDPVDTILLPKLVDAGLTEQGIYKTEFVMALLLAKNWD